MSQSTNAKDKAERRRRKLVSMLADPATAPPIKQAARLLNVSRKTVQRDLEAIRPDIQEAESLLDAYKASIRATLPIPQRVALYVENARQNTNPFARQKALERLDDLDGIIPDVERLKIERQHEQPAPGPMFVFNGGLNIDFGGRREDIDAIDITPTEPIETMIEAPPDPGERE